MTKYRKPTWAPQRRAVATGEALKANALALLTERREAVIRRAQRTLLTALLECGLATADHVRAHVELPPGIAPRCFGTAPSPLAHTALFAPTATPRQGGTEAHARPVTVWRLADRAAAVRWLADNPDLPDAADVDQGDAVQRVLFTTQENRNADG